VYPNTATTYKLPFDDTVKVASKCRYVLVRDVQNGPNHHNTIVRRSDTLATLERIYDPATDYIIDQGRGFVTYHFNGKQETWDAIEGRHLYGPGPFVVHRPTHAPGPGEVVSHSLHGGRQII
jgi:hypothetical protein